MIRNARDPRRRILVMGGTGTIGSHLVRELARDADLYDLRATARSPQSAAVLQAAGFSPVHLDLEQQDTLLPAMQGVDTLFMLKPYSIEYLIQSKRVIDVAVKAGVRYLVNLGSFGADDTPWSSIGWNRLVEAYLAQSGLAHTTLRPNFFMDNVFARTDLDSGRIIHYFGDQPVSWIAAEDIAKVAAAVLRRPGEFAGRVLPLASDARTMAEVARALSATTGRTFTAVHIRGADALPQLLSRGWEPSIARPFVDYMTAISEGLVAEVADTARTVEEVTGEAAIHWEDFARRHAGRFGGKQP